MEKICEYCGEPFEAINSRQKFCNRIHYVTCPICGERRQVKNKDQLSSLMTTGPTACSYECRVKKTQMTSMATYGCIAPGNNPEARKKARETCKKTTGFEYAMQSKDVRNKSKSTLLTKLGVDNAGKSKQVIEKRMKTNHDRYGDILPFNRPECYDKQHKTMLDRYGVPYGSMTPNAIKASKHISKMNLKFQQALESCGIKTKLEKSIENRIYDICLPDQNILVEINPSYTHSILGNHYSSKGLDKYYHRDKTELANEHGYQCIHIWNWDNAYRIVDYLRPRVKMNCDGFTVYRLTKESTNEFLKNNHIQGTRRGQKLSLGLVKNEEIYQIMTFGEPSYNNKHSFQLYRMCTKPGFEIEGGYDKLSTVASIQFGVSDLIAYVDRSKFDGHELEAIGMTQTRVSPPRLIWSKNHEYVTDNLRISKLHKSEDTMINEGWLPVYDCGQLVYEFS